MFWGFNSHLWGIQGDRWENIHFLNKPRHVTPQIDHLGQLGIVMRVSTHIYEVSKERDGKTFIFSVNLHMWLPQIDHLGKIEPCYEGFNMHLWGFQEDRWENIHFLNKPKHVTPQINNLRKLKTCSEGFNIHLWGFQEDRWQTINF